VPQGGIGGSRGLASPTNCRSLPGDASEFQFSGALVDASVTRVYPYQSKPFDSVELLLKSTLFGTMTCYFNTFIVFV
jgi:hypothetical protein